MSDTDTTLRQPDPRRADPRLWLKETYAETDGDVESIDIACDAILALAAAEAAPLDVERLARAIVDATRAVAVSHWDWLKGDGWPAYDENGTTQVLVVNEFAEAIAREYAALGKFDE